MRLETINPSTGKLIKKYNVMNKTECLDIISTMDDEFRIWRKSDFKSRAEKLKIAARILKDRKRDLAKLMAEEMGKPILQGIAEIEKCAWAAEYYAENAEKFLSPEIVKTDATKSFVVFQPLGIIFAIMPWNFPFWQVFRCTAPCLMAGNAILLKHASNVTGCALEIEKIIHEAGFPKEIFRTLVINHGMVEQIIKNEKIKAVTLTGSTEAGRTVAAQAGEALKKVVLELGGSDPYVILEDADLDQAAAMAVKSRLLNTGQSCISAKRFIVVKKLKDKFEKLVVNKMSVETPGDPFDETVSLGPMAREDLRDELHEQVKKSVKMGANLLLGGNIPKSPGAFYPPTVLSHVKEGMPAFDEEMFGPVAAIIEAKDDQDAIRLANNSRFGLGAAIFTMDIKRGERIASSEIEAGSCFVNSFVKSDPRLPFGGIKESGYGRELSSFGIREFVNIKTVYIL